MSKTKAIKTEGKIVKILPNGNFRVLLDNTKKEVLCHLSGKMRQNYIKLVMGDRVKIELSPYDLSRGRITYRID